MQGFVLVPIAVDGPGRVQNSWVVDGVSPVSLASTDAARPTHWGVLSNDDDAAEDAPSKK